MSDLEEKPQHTHNAHLSRPAPEVKMSAGQYATTRLTTLKPPMAKVTNPIRLLRLLNLQQWLFFLVAFFAWSWDAFDFFTVSLTVEDLAETFGKTKTDITWGITLVLMLRSVGSIIFGLAADRYGRKWPFVINNVLFIILELGTGFCSTYNQFLAVRALFGIAMGGLYGNAAATALEDCPEEARGILSGMLQQGYAFGYLLATVFARAFVNTVGHGWRPVSTLPLRTPPIS
jgi:SHS family lactate transporter-like MFS transporter